ncbi:unnamed protein product [Merluccius merluccius]
MPTAILALPINALVLRLLLGKSVICSTSEVFTLLLASFDLVFCLGLWVEYALLLAGGLAGSHFVSWGLNRVGDPLLLRLLCLDSRVSPVGLPGAEGPPGEVVSVRHGYCHSAILIRAEGSVRRMSVACVVALAILVTSYSNLMVPAAGWCTR